MGDVVKVGPWGAAGGHDWSILTNGGKITCILIVVDGNIITFLEFVYDDKDGKSCHARPFDRTSTINATVIEFEEDEALSAIRGTFDEKGITSITFRTNKQVYGPYGAEKGSEFSLPVDHGAFEGFFGSNDDDYVIRSLGVVLRP